MCGNRRCGCIKSHETHQINTLSGIILAVRAPPLLSEETAKLEKSIDTLIDGLATEVAQLKNKHNEHVRIHVDGFTKHAGLKHKLLQREPLQMTEATGDCFSQLLTEVEGLRVMPSPYRLSLQQLEKQIVSVRERLGTIVADIESVWKGPKLAELTYRFSDTLKGATIALSEGSLRAKNTNNNYYYLAVV
jgi:ribosome-associated translation inhibitor RaiA